MTRAELYHSKPKQSSFKGLFFFILACIVLTAGFFVFRYFYQNTIRIEAPIENPGPKVVIHLPNGQKVYTYENLIFEKDGKTYYKGERNTIDLTGGTVDFEEWK
ncbi:hypothetical protein V7157_26630 [Neobacillus drentensis]|uniref:hypothetical protein n=1 Tax=Bacillaceae TaxID=186817 RepID=UPI000BFB5C4A|nr:hypothetical protein [Bacillus sp. AFS031507]PGY08502.1 hypothetical protein COE25_21310 [Bacillus sp. AFS031507]